LQHVCEDLRERITAQGLFISKAQDDRTKTEAAHAELLVNAPALHALEAETKAVQWKLENQNKVKFNKALELGALKKEVNPFRAQMEANKKEAQAVSAKAKEKKDELKDTRDLQARFEFWIKGFKDVRFQVMQESLAQLNAETNECLHQLGLTDWALEFIVEKENKSGTVKRGFLCEVRSPYTEEAMPWEVWSGGESQRLRLATQLGVSNMLCSRLGLEFDFEMWDEPTSNLSPGGINDLMTVLQDRATRYGRRIFLADHRALDFDFSGRLVVTKTEDGSQLGEVEVR
jgi:DNA repair exonuclease SbcCD ATPase subunit